MAETAQLPLKGKMQGSQRRIDGKGVIKSSPDPLVVERGKAYAYGLEKIEDEKDKANTLAQDLVSVFSKSKRARTVKIQTERRTYYFSLRQLTKLVTEKKQSVN